MADHEIPVSANQSIEDVREEAHRRALEDGAGFSVHAADVALNGVEAGVVRARQGAETPVSHRPANRRGGRSFTEPSDSELDPNWNVQRPEPITDKERAASHDAYLQAKAYVNRALGPQMYDELTETAKKLGISPAALIAARQSKANRGKSA